MGPTGLACEPFIFLKFKKCSYFLGFFQVNIFWLLNSSLLNWLTVCNMINNILIKIHTLIFQQSLEDYDIWQANGYSSRFGSVF